jgi:aspartyl-tRNA(Asn)/glutamyl-tRNA(Gln) amidotransferase subunit A
VQGLPTTKGSLLYKDKVADSWEYSAKRLIDAGGIHLGKTNTPEFGFIPTTENRLFGPTFNPWDTDRTAGGSSGGAGAQVAAGLGPLALGSDGGGSIRIPSSLCGIFGFKATYGRVPRNPGGWATMTHRGPMTRTVRDAALMLDVMAGHEPGDPFSVVDHPTSYLDGIEGGIEGLRVAFTPDMGYAPVDPEVRDACKHAARRFEELGCSVEEAHPVFTSPTDDLTFFVLAASHDAAWLDELTDEQRELLDEPARQFYAAGKRFTAIDYVRAENRRLKIWETMRAFHTRYDLLLAPVVSVTAFPVGNPPTQIDGQKVNPLGWMTLTSPFNLTGQPAASIPVGFDSRGLPIGMQVIGRAYEDALVLRACRAFEQAQPWADRTPALQEVMSR